MKTMKSDIKKNAVFFSYSKDKEVFLALKEKITTEATNPEMIFISSDEDSIKGGDDYIKTIKSALDNAVIVFLFITPHSHLSPWLHYEAGYAEAKGKVIIPIGIKMDIASMIAPINKIQGRNVESADDLNFLIRNINNVLKTDIDEIFTNDDFVNLNEKIEATYGIIDGGDSSIFQ